MKKLYQRNELTRESTQDNQEEKEALIYPQVRCALVTSIGLLVSGMGSAWTGAALTKLDKDFKMEATEYSLVVSVFSYGSLCGSLFAGRGMDYFGRKKLMLGISPLVALGWVLIGVATNVYKVCAGRFVTGFCSGVLFTSSSIYTSETCQPTLRGRLGSLPTISLALGVLISYILGGFFTWRISAFLSIIPVAALLIGFCMIPESPYWFLLKGNPDMATRSLKKLRGPRYNTNKELTVMMEKMTEVGTNLGLREFLNKRTFYPLAVAVYLQTVLQLSGGPILTQYTSSVYKATQTSIDPQIATIFSGIAKVLGTILSVFFIDKYGRQPLLVTSISICGVFLCILGTYFLLLFHGIYWPDWVPLLIIALFDVSLCLGCVTIPYLIGSEIFNTSIRSRANSIVIVYNRFINILICQLYPYIVSAVGVGPVFLFLGILDLAFGVGAILWVPETKGKSLEEIQEYFEKKTAKPTVPSEASLS